MDELFKIAAGTDKTFVLLLAMFVGGGIKWFWERQQRLEKTNDFLPRLTEELQKTSLTLEKVMDRLERHEDREERIFDAILARLDNRRSRVEDENQTVRILRDGEH